MPKTKKNSRKPAVRVPDLEAKKDPKGGLSDIHITKPIDKPSTTLSSTTATNTK